MDRPRVTLPAGRALAVASIAAALMLAACSGDDPGDGASVVAPVPSSTTASAVSPSSGGTSTSGGLTATPTLSVAGTIVPLGAPQVLATGLRVPWGLAFLPDGSALVAERTTGRIVRVLPSGGTRTVGTVAGVSFRGEGGLLGLAVSPDASRVFAYLTSTRGDNRVISMPYDGTSLGPATVLLSGIPSGPIHNGGRLAIGPDGMLWIGTGESGDRPRSQDRSDLGGKILRIALDGSFPPDNPFPGSPVWSYGHRNVQGLAFDSRGRLWATEFGQDTWDELNLVRKGGNHGWPLVEGRGGDPRYVDPVVVWRTDAASPSGIAIVDDVAYIGALHGRRLWQVPLSGDSAGRPVAALAGRYGRIRTVVAAPDGSLWITTSNRDGRGDPASDDDKVIRIPLG